MHVPTPWRLCCSLALASGLGLLAPTARAQEVVWRDDYNKARQEASDKGRPLLIDLGTENCYWCKQLDLRTFKDPAVVALLNDRFVPLKVDAQRTPALAEALNIQNYPTLVFASPDGRIVGYQEGFLEPAALKERLERTLMAVVAPEWMTRDYQDAQRAVANADYARAIALLKNVVEDGRERPIQRKAREMLQELEQQAASRYARARQLAEKGLSTEASEIVTDLVKAYPGTQAAREGGQLLLTLTSRTNNGNNEQRARRARELLGQAREEYRAQNFLGCLDRCEALAASFADLPEGAEAAQLAAEIKSNPEWAKQAAEQLGDRLSVLYLALADTWLKRGQPQQAVFYLERVVQGFPHSRHAELAQVRLAQIQGPPVRNAEVKK